MSDLYLEELVKRKRTTMDSALRLGLMALSAVLVVLALLSWNIVIIVAAIAICVADIFVFPRFNTEWEYQYVNTARYTSSPGVNPNSSSLLLDVT